MEHTVLPSGYEIFRDVNEKIEIAKRDNKAGSYSNAHYHYCLEFIYVVKGEINATVSEEAIKVGAGELLLISSCEQHSIEYLPETRHCILVMPHRYFANYSFVLAKKLFSPRRIKDDFSCTILRMLELFYSIEKREGIYSNISDERYEKLVTSLSNTFIETILGMVTLKSREYNPSSQAVNVMEYIYSHYKQSLSMTMLARVHLCNQQELSESFRKTFGLTPMACVNRLRAEDALEVMQKEPKITLEELAERSGFQSISTMLRVFRCVYGCTPKELRAKRTT